MVYTSNDLANITNRTPQAIKKWSDEFAEFLSVTATPGKGKKRIYTEDDARVLLLVSESKRLGQGNEAIHAALKSGQRASLPEPETGLSEVSNREVYDLRAALKTTTVQADQLRQVLDTARLSEARAHGERDALKRELDEARQEIIKLNIKLASQDSD